MDLSQIITNPATGKISMTRLAGATAHLNAALWFAWLTYAHGFIPELWMIYLGATITHNGMSKAIASVRDVQMAQAAKVQVVTPPAQEEGAEATA